MSKCVCLTPINTPLSFNMGTKTICMGVMITLWATDTIKRLVIVDHITWLTLDAVKMPRKPPVLCVFFPFQLMNMPSWDELGVNWVSKSKLCKPMDCFGHTAKISYPKRSRQILTCYKGACWEQHFQGLVQSAPHESLLGDVCLSKNTTRDTSNFLNVLAMEIGGD